VKAVILAGGLATRMRPLTDARPKALLPIVNRPFLEHQIRLLASHGVDEAILLTGYLADDFGPFIEDVAHLGVRLEVSTEDEPLGTAGAVRRVLDDLDDTTIVFNGDVLTDLDIGAMILAHRDTGAIITISLAPVEDARPYGLVSLDDENRILAFHEKPAELVSGLINAGTYVLERKALADRAPGERFMFETDVFPSLLDAGEPLCGYPSSAYWLDIGTPERYRHAHIDVLEGRTHAQIDGELIRDDARVEGGLVRGPSVIARPIVLGPGAVVGPLSSIGPACMIGARARVERSVLHEDVRIGIGAVVRDSILGRGVRVPVNAQVIGEVLA